MTRPRLPTFVPEDLQDHATRERVDAVWSRIEQDVNLGAVRAPRRYRMWAGVAAAAVAVFVGGYAAGRLTHKATALVPMVEHPVEAVNGADVLAAGSRQRTYVLPGGAQVTLTPGSTIEVVRHNDKTVEVRLVQGEASVDTAALAAENAVAITAEETTLSTTAGSVVRVRRSVDDLDVAVAAGTVHITSPGGQHQLDRGQHIESLPIRTVVASHPHIVVRPVTPFVHPLPVDTSSPSEPPKVMVAAAPDWQALWSSGNSQGAIELLRKQPGGIDGAISQARSAAELMELHDLSAMAGERTAAMRALTRVVNEFPEPNYAQLAALKLGDAYKAAGQHDKAQMYYDKARGYAAPLAEDALCRRLRAAANKDDAAKLAQEYLTRYPNGPCKQDAERILGGEDNAEDDPPPAADAQPH